MASRAGCGQAWRLTVFTTVLVVAGAVGASSGGGTARAVLQPVERMPLLFVPEPVPTDGTTGFVVRGREASVWLDGGRLSYWLHPSESADGDPLGWVVALELVGAAHRQPAGEDRLATRVSHFSGPRDRWRTGLPSYASVRYREPWPGIDLVVSGVGGRLETSFIVRPGADPRTIRLAYRGATALRLDPDGTLFAETPIGSIREQAPIAFQEVGGRRVEVAAAFELAPGGETGVHGYRFLLGDYDPALELVVDPVTFVNCGYIGGSGDDRGYAVAVDAEGSAYVTGTTTSTQTTFPVAVGPDLTHNTGQDVFVAKLNAAGTALEYCGYIGGVGNDIGYGIAVDGAGNAYVTGDTNSNQTTFPVIVGPDLTYNGSSADAFVAKVNAAGTALEYCGYIGGSLVDRAYGIAVDASGRALVTGGSTSTDLPVAVGPDLAANGNYDAFVARVNATGTALDYCGYVGGSALDAGYGIAVDAAGNAYVAGLTASSEATFPVTVGPDLTFNGSTAGDAFVAKVSPTGSTLAYCGYIGGTDSDGATGIAVDAAGNAFVVGFTISTQASFPVTVGPDLSHNGAIDAFVARVNATGTGLASCGYIGGVANEYGRAIALDADGAAYVTGYTTSGEATFPVSGGPDLTYNGGISLGDAFVAKLAAGGTALDFCGYIGGSADEGGYGIAVDGARRVTVVGSTASTEGTFPVTVGPDLSYNGGAYDAFVARVDSADFTLDASPGAVEICAGEAAEYTVTVGASGGFSADVTLGASGHPAGSTADFSVNPVTPPGSSVLTIGSTGGAAGGSYDVTINGSTGGGLSHDVGVTLDVVAGTAPAPTLIAPPDGATSQPLRPTFAWTAVATADSFTLEVDDDPAFGSPAIVVSGLSSTSYAAPSDLQLNTVYSWRVSSENLCGTGSPSDAFEFDTNCSYAIDPTSASFDETGGPGSISVTAQAGCDWTAVSNVGWATVTGGASGSGNGAVTYNVQANSSPDPRTGTLTVAGHTFTINQDGITCAYTIDPTSASFDETGGPGSISVTAQAGCGWTAVSNVGWVTVTGGSSGSGNGTVTYSVAANDTGSQRVGTMTIAGETFTVTQEGGTDVFADGFESGDLSAWSAAVPDGSRPDGWRPATE